MKIWILLLIAGVLLAWAMCRERFDASTTPATGATAMPGFPSGGAPTPTGGDDTEYTDPICPTGMSRNAIGGKCRYSEAGTPFTCPSGYVPTADRMCRKIAGPYSQPIEPSCPEGKVLIDSECVRPPIQPTCPSGYTSAMGGNGIMCSKPRAPTSGGEVAPNGGGSGSLFTSGNTTGGSSSTSAGPNSGGGGNRRKQVFGPMFTGVGEGGNVQGGSEDSSKTNQYPELMGGGDVRSSTRIDGVGIVDPSKNSDTTGLPTSGGLGSNEDSKFLPTSRVPGDMEKIPDPWRVSQSFSASNYSFKTDPVPFLTNFSAFQK